MSCAILPFEYRTDVRHAQRIVGLLRSRVKEVIASPLPQQVGCCDCGPDWKNIVYVASLREFGTKQLSSLQEPQ